MWAHLLVCQLLLPVLWHLWICRRYTLSHHPGHWLSCSIVVAALSAPGNTINDWTFFLRTQYFMTRSPPSFQPNSLSTYLAHISLVFFYEDFVGDSVRNLTKVKINNLTSNPLTAESSRVHQMWFPLHISVLTAPSPPSPSSSSSSCLEMPSSRSLSFPGWPAFSSLGYPHLELRCFFRFVSLLEDRYCSSNVRDGAVLLKTLWV